MKIVGLRIVLFNSDNLSEAKENKRKINWKSGLPHLYVWCIHDVEHQCHNSW